MVVGLTGVSVQVVAFRVANVTALIQRMVDYLALVMLKEPAQQKLLKCWAAEYFKQMFTVLRSILTVILKVHCKLVRMLWLDQHF